MKKSVFLLLAASALLANDEGYVPFSQFSDNEKEEYKFIKLVKVVEVKKIEKLQENMNDVQVKKTPIVKKINKPIMTKVVKEDVKTAVKQTQSVEQVKHANIVREGKTLVTIRADYSPLNVNYSTTSGSQSSDSNSFEPQVELKNGKHKVAAKYFKSENSFTGTNLDATWYKLGYKYNYKNANVGLDLNHLTIEKNTSETEEVFPSLELDFENNIDSVALNYGASLGKNSNIDYSYEYFLNIGLKPSSLSDSSLLLGYKNRTVRIEESDEKIEFKGPFIGVNSSF